MMRSKLFVLLLIIPIFACASEYDFGHLMQELLHRNREYLSFVGDRKQELARMNLEKSSKLPELTVEFQTWSNEIEREEWQTDLRDMEVSGIDEEDRRMNLELNQQIFGNDFDYADDGLSGEINSFCVDLKKKITICSIMDEIIEKQIEIYEARKMKELIRKQINEKKREYEAFSMIQKRDVAGTDELIEILEDLNKMEKEHYKYDLILKEAERSKAGMQIEFINAFSEYISRSVVPDTISFATYLTNVAKKINYETDHISKKIKLYGVLKWFPEFNLTASYHWRWTEQDWEIESGLSNELRNREQSENYPELQIGLSLPLDVHRNYKSRHLLLLGYKEELEAERQELIYETNEFYNKKTRSLIFRKANMERQKFITELRRQKVDEITTLKNKGVDKLSVLYEKEELKLQKAEINFRISEMKYYQEVFLINLFGDITK